MLFSKPILEIILLILPELSSFVQLALQPAGVERSFSIMNRLCTQLRQRMTSEHLDQLVLIAQEGPEELSRVQLMAVLYTWYKLKPRRIQLPRLS